MDGDEPTPEELEQLATIPAWAAAATYSNRRGVEWTARRNHDE